MTHDTSNERPERVAIYARISQNPRNEAEKIDRQIKECLRHMRGSQTLVLDPETGGHFVDDGISAYQGEKERPAYQRLLETVKAGEVDVVITYNTDRMLRTVREMVDFIAIANWGGKDDWTSIDPAKVGTRLDFSQPGGKMLAQIMAAVAQHEVDLKSVRHMTANESRRAEGKRLGGPVPFGWRKSAAGAIEPDPEERALILDGIRWRTQGDDAPRQGEPVSMSEIGRRWTKSGPLPRSRKGKQSPWTQNNVRKVLVRPANAGLAVHGGAVRRDVPSPFPALCSVEEWEEMVGQATARARPEGRRPESFLTGLLTCGACDSRMAADTAKGRKLYKCRACGLQVERSETDEAVLEVCQDALTVARVTDLVPDDGSLVRAEQYRAEIEDATALMREAVELHKKRKYTTADLNEVHDAEQARIDRATDRLAQIEERNAFALLLSREAGDHDRWLGVAGTLATMPLPKRRTIVSGLFPKITVAPVPRPGPRLTPEQRLTFFDRAGERVDVPRLQLVATGMVLAGAREERDALAASIEASEG